MTSEFGRTSTADGEIHALALPILAGLQELAGRIDDEMLLGTSSDQAIALLERARSLLQNRMLEPQPCQSTAPGFARGGLAGWQMRALTQYIDLNLEGKLCLEQLAAVAGLSTSYLCRAFRQSRSCSPMQYVMQRRLNVARTLLRDGRLALSEIAIRCGFADQPHFTRVFRTATGETPRRWRCQFGARPQPRDLSGHASAVFERDRPSLLA